ncbi:MAG: hypothetical protein JSW73_05645 [Candidatus Woesearchaeota archaeon]|nr:MAG: hypothetical protein JSW73_05645 [Candidatus Woesearchaeota archaeon]
MVKDSLENKLKNFGDVIEHKNIGPTNIIRILYDDALKFYNDSIINGAQHGVFHPCTKGAYLMVNIKGGNSISEKILYLGPGKLSKEDENTYVFIPGKTEDMSDKDKYFKKLSVGEAELWTLTRTNPPKRDTFINFDYVDSDITNSKSILISGNTQCKDEGIVFVKHILEVLKEIENN